MLLREVREDAVFATHPSSGARMPPLPCILARSSMNWRGWPH
jgi:hypothetical protein